MSADLAKWSRASDFQYVEGSQKDELYLADRWLIDGQLVLNVNDYASHFESRKVENMRIYQMRVGREPIKVEEDDILPCIGSLWADET